MHDVFEQVFEGHPDAWSILERDGDRIIIVCCNESQARRFGMQRVELEYADLRDWVEPAHYEGWLALIREMENATSARSFDVPGKAALSVTIVPLRSGPSGLPRFSAQIRDDSERKAPEVALSGVDARLAQARAIGNTGDWELCLETGTGTWSPEMFRIMDWRGDQPATLEQFEALVHLEDRKALAAFQRDLLSSTEPRSLVFRVVTPAGETRRVATTAVSIRNEQGKPIRIAGVNRDVSAPEDALESVRRHDDALNVLFEENVHGVYFSMLDEPIDWENSQNKDALAEWALDHARPVRVNQALCAVVNAPPQALIGKPLVDFFPDREEAREQFKRLYDVGRLHLSRVARVRVDGTRWLADVDMVVTRDEKGRIAGQFGVLRDVTAQEQAAEALRQSEARLSLALESAELYAWSFDIQAGRMDVDAGWAAHLGYTVEEMASGTFARNMVHPADFAGSELAFREHFAGKTPSVSASYRIATRAGAWRWIETHGKVTERDAGGAPLRMTGICRDVTERRALEQRLLMAERMASLGTLAAGIGHEINNPLTYLSANLALMEDAVRAQIDGKSDATRVEELSRMLADARDGVARIVRIVRDLRSLTRSESAPREAVDLRQVIERSLQLADHEIRHRARVERHFAELPQIVADEGRLIQLFLNLLVNAAQAINEGAPDANFIRVAARPAENSAAVVLEVSDSGRGMDQDVLARIFDPFFTTKEVGEGTGLGLPICHSIVRDLGGSIEVESAPGKGSTFRIRLPVQHDVAKRDASAPAPADAGPSARLRILVVDDEATVGRLLTRILRGHDVAVETRASSALARLRSGEHFDRILCDVMMPEMSGMDLYEALEASSPEVLGRIIFMTGGAFSARASAFLARIPNVTVDKPFDPRVLRRIVTEPRE